MGAKVAWICPVSSRFRDPSRKLLLRIAFVALLTALWYLHPKTVLAADETIISLQQLVFGKFNPNSGIMNFLPPGGATDTNRIYLTV